MSDNQTEKGHFRLYSYPAKRIIEKVDEKKYKKLTFVVSNDFAGNINPTYYPIKNRFKEKRILKVGGISAMKAYLNIFREEFKDKLVYVDAGSFLHPEDNHSFTIFLYNYLGVDAAALGLNEFLINRNSTINYPKYIQAITKKSQFKILNSNVTYLLSDIQLQNKGIASHTIKEVNGVKIGFIGALTQNLSKKIPDHNINGLHIENPAKNVILSSNALRKKGAQVIVLMANSGINCSSMLAVEESILEEKVNFNTKQSKFCNTHKNQFYKLLQELPPQTVDLVFTSGEETKVANKILGYPVLQSPGRGKFFSWVEVYFDKKHNLIDRAKTKIHQPVQLCHNFLKDSQDCFTLEGTTNQELIPATFLGQKLNIEPLPSYE
jgi:2',3'-cyclic-nucleotide 2'-phosphodiesterase (5'-nucleotidase family)